MKRIFLLSIIAVISLLFQGCGDSNIDLVKNSNFPGYETTTIGNMLDNAFEGTKWSSQENSKGETMVLFEGKVSSKMHDSLKNKMLNFIATDAGTDDNFAIVTYTAHNIPAILGADRTGDNFAEPLLSECIEKYKVNQCCPVKLPRITD